jgi:flagellar hook assembly protein FlgD
VSTAGQENHHGRRTLATLVIVASLIMAAGVQPAAAASDRATDSPTAPRATTPIRASAPTPAAETIALPTPTNVHVDPGDGGVRITFDTVPDPEGSTRWHVISSPGNIVGIAKASPWEISGLTNGVTYTFTMVAFKDLDLVSAPSAASNAVTPVAPPTDVPTITAPTSGALTSAVVTVTAASTHPFVWFEIDAAPQIAVTPVVGGVASTSWDSVGSPNGAHTVAAHSCFTASRQSCNMAATASVSYVVANTGPPITAPTSGQVVSSSMTMSATTPVGGVAFFVDGVQVGQDVTSPFEVTVPVAALANGTHIATTKLCRLNGQISGIDNWVCDGPVSAPVSFQVRNLLPTIPSISGSPFNPKVDGVRDTVTVHYSLPDTETAKWSVRNSAGTVIKGPVALGTLTKGTRTFVWNGKDKAAKVVSGGTYTIVIATTGTSNGQTVYGQVTRAVVVDRSTPAITYLSSSGQPWYSGANQDRKTPFQARGELSERATLVVTVRTASGALVRTLSTVHPAGSFLVTWGGWDTAGKLVPSGNYKWSIRATDPAGNQGKTSSSTTHLIHLANRTATFNFNGNQLYEAVGTNTSCGWYSPQASRYANGVVLHNECTGFERVQADFKFYMQPYAIFYDTVTILANGVSTTGSSTIYAAIGDGTGWSPIGGQKPASGANAWYDLGTTPGNFVYGNGLTYIGVGVNTALGTPAGFDLNAISITAHYRVAV